MISKIIPALSSNGQVESVHYVNAPPAAVELDIMNDKTNASGDGHLDTSNITNFSPCRKPYNEKDIEVFNQSKEEMMEKWHLVSIIIDRVLIIVFSCFTLIVTVAMFTYIVLSSEENL